MKSLIPNQVNSALDAIVAKCFEGNRIADRGMSILNVKFAMSMTEEVLHESLAHIFPVLADHVSSYQGSRNALTAYGVTTEDVSDYDTPLDFFEKIHRFCVDLEAVVSEALDLSRDIDIMTYAFLLDFLKEVGIVTEQCLLLVDKATHCESYMIFDHIVEDFIILETMEDD
jgi:hypothetical protein